MIGHGSGTHAALEGGEKDVESPPTTLHDLHNDALGCVLGHAGFWRIGKNYDIGQDLSRGARSCMERHMSSRHNPSLL